MNANIRLLMYDNWYQRHYDLLRRRVCVWSPTDKDSFHDAYLYLRHYLIFCQEDIVDYTPYFITVYRSVRKKSITSEKRYVHPEDWFFQILDVEDDSVGEIERKMLHEKMYARIMAFVRCRFPTDYRLFCLKVVTPGCSYRELQLYTGIRASALRKKILTIKETIKKEIKYETNYLQQ